MDNPNVAAARTVMVVDDNPHAADALAQYLRLDGFAVVTAENGLEALGFLQRGLTPDLIVLDLTMPIMDGWQFRRQQLADPQLARIPVVVCTAVPPRDDSAHLEGVLATCIKPVEPRLIADYARLCGR